MNDGPTKVIIDTDLFSDVDDVGALAAAHTLADRGAAEIAAIGVNTPSRWGHQAARIVCLHYGRDNTPVGALLPLDDSVFEVDYAKRMCDRFPLAHAVPKPRSAPEVFREVLAACPDGSVTVVSIGFFGNLTALLASAADRASSLTGVDLVRQKVANTVVMGGKFPEGKEFNIASFPHEARSFVAGWPVPILFVGFEVGADVITGYSFPPGSAGQSPVAAAYQDYTGGQGRASWDLIAVNTAVRGPGQNFELSAPGRLAVSETGENTWIPDPIGPHRYLIRVNDPGVIAAELEDLLVAGPGSVRPDARPGR